MSKGFRAKIVKVGNSLMITVPNYICKYHDLKPGLECEFLFKGGCKKRQK